MKKILALILACLTVCLPMMMTSCSENSTDLKDYDLEKYVSLGEYKGIKVTRKTITVDEDDVRAEVDKMLDSFAETVDLKEDDVLQLKDNVSVTYVGRIKGEYEGFTDGEEIANTDDKADTFSIGYGNHIPGFETSYIGYHPGDQYSFDITVPDNYTLNPKLSGVVVTFSGTVKSAKRDVQPEYTDAFVAEKTEFKTIAEYEADLLEKLRAAADEQEMIDEITEAWQAVMDKCEVIKYPDAVVDARYKESMANFETTAKAYNMTVEDLAKAMYNMTSSEFESSMRTQCQQLVFEEMVLTMIIDREGISISDKEYSEGLAKYAERNGVDDVQKFEEEYGADTIRESLLWDKTLMFLLERADVSEDTGTGDGTELAVK